MYEGKWDCQTDFLDTCIVEGFKSSVVWSLLAKIQWRFGEVREALLREIIGVKYGEFDCGWFPIWKDILNWAHRRLC